MSFDVSSVLAARPYQPLMLRLLQIDNIGFFQFGIANVSLLDNVVVPKPSSVSLLGVGVAGLLAALGPEGSWPAPPPDRHPRDPVR